MKRFLLSLLVIVFSVSLTMARSASAITPETALQAYLHNADKSFEWQTTEKIKVDGGTVYRVIMTSQTWRNIPWKHEMFIMVPDILKFKDALLFITGGHNSNTVPSTHKVDEALAASLVNLAKTNMSVVALLWQVPNQPLYGDRTEDALISYTLHQYLGDHDLTWPLLFPMTKSAVRAMDVVQKFAQKEIKHKIEHFVVSGASKRGWTTWLTGANDKRVKAIGPMVIDVLNMPVNVDYQRKVWGDYSIQIEDYVKLGIAQQFNTAGGSDLVKMVDPYSYRKTLTMPKMLFMGTNDPYWPADAVKNYIDSIPGDNHICYTPNAGHGLGDQKKALTTLSAFFGTTVTNGKYPICHYTLSQNNHTATITIKTTPELLVEANLWSADSKDQDFRDEKWNGQTVQIDNKAEITVQVPIPASGFKAFYVDLVYKAPFGPDFTQSTRMFVADNQQVLLKKN